MSNYNALYRQKLTTPEIAIGKLKDGDTIVYGFTASVPPMITPPQRPATAGG